MGLDSLRRQLLDARDARAAVIARLAGALPPGHTLLFLSLNVPGPGKNDPRLDPVIAATRESILAEFPGSRLVGEGRDAAGAWAAMTSVEAPEQAKRRAVSVEERTPARRLVDLDVYAAGGGPVDRRSLGLPPRPCLVCHEAAADCIRTGRHPAPDLAAAVDGLLRSEACRELSAALVLGARAELELTPKPGLVDRRDNGSHPDLSFQLMSRSIDLLPEYFDELLLMTRQQIDLVACIDAARRAEQRMVTAIGANAHRGYIFLSGLLLLACAAGPASRADLRRGVADMARRVLAALRPHDARTHGSDVRARLGVGGIHAEALDGLPSVFEHGLPVLEAALGRFGSTEAAHHYLMASLMTKVEDTTAVHRCGVEGLERLRADGRRVMAAIEDGADYLGLLARLNDEYRAARLTMGGVADCMAITIGLRLVEQG